MAGSTHYEDLDPTPRIEQLLTEIDAELTCIFWGCCTLPRTN
jgi:hypothetical protein